MRYFNHSLKVALLCLCTTVCNSALSEPRTYDIELLVFQNLVDSDNSEVWNNARLDASEADREPAAAIDSAAVNWLPAATLRLAAVQASLRGSAGYRPIAHLAWRQSVEDRKRAQAISLPPGDKQSGDASVSGSVSVAVERYLHLSLDLALHDTGYAAWPEQARQFRLVEQRRMRSKELHYFDHPRFGVLALITPYQPESR